MPAAGVFVLAVVVLVFAGWIWAEIKGPRWLRISAGLASIALIAGVVGIHGMLRNFEAAVVRNAVSRDLVLAVTEGLENGKEQQVLQSLKKLQLAQTSGDVLQLAHYDEHLWPTVQELRKEIATHAVGTAPSNQSPAP